MNGYATPGSVDPDACAGTQTRKPLATPKTTAPRIAVLWSDLASDGSLARCSGAMSQLSWSTSSNGDPTVDGYVRSSSVIAAAGEFTSTAIFVATWSHLRYSSQPSSTCTRSTFQLVLAVSSVSGECYVIMLYAGLAAPPAPADTPVVSMRGRYDSLDVYSGGVPAAAVAMLADGSNAGSQAGVHVWRVSGLAETLSPLPPHLLSYSLTLVYQGLDFTTLQPRLSAFRNDTVAAFSTALQLPPNRIVIVSIIPGTVVVQLDIMHTSGQEQQAIDRLAAVLDIDALALLTRTYMERCASPAGSKAAGLGRTHAAVTCSGAFTDICTSIPICALLKMHACLHT